MTTRLPKTADEVRQARERKIRRHFKAGASIHTLAWWYHHTTAEIEAIIRRGFAPTRAQEPTP